jgi:cytochrome P450
MRDVISELLDEWAPKGQFDFVEFASHFPITVFCGLMGISTVSAPGIREAFEVQAASTTLDRALLPALLAGYDLTSKFADKLVADREQSGVKGDGMLDELIAAKHSGKLNETELRHMLLLLINAGYDTSKNMLSLLMHTMIQHPDMWTRCAEDRAYCSKVVEEIFRQSGVSSIYRTVTKEFTYDGVTFPEGTVLIFLVGIAGRDPAVYEDPMAFNPDRVHAQRHMAFGRGVHICIGQHLAKIQIEEGVHMIAQRLTKPRLAGEVKWRPYLGIWGIKSLPIAFTPGKMRKQAAE